MGSVNSINTKIDQTVQIFDEFYAYSANVPAQEYDAVFSYLNSVFGTAEAAGNFAVTMFRIAEQSDIPVMTLLQQIQGLGVPELTLTLAYYLNGNRSSSTLLGLNAPTTPNYYAAHNIRL
jgi:pyruvate/2-oxoacid:ferredoxin oxidoreductase alpha subunit